MSPTTVVNGVRPAASAYAAFRSVLADSAAALATFRVPASWVEEYEEDGGGTFYDRGADAGTLRLSVITMASKTPVTTRSGRDILERRAAEKNQEVVDLEGGGCLLRYTQDSEAEGEPLEMHYWELANVVPPNHLRLAVFSYTVAKRMSSCDEVVKELVIVDREVSACRFATEVGE